MNFLSLIHLTGFCCLLPIYLLAQPSFQNVTEDAGIRHSFEVFQGTFGGGAVVIDYNQDGWEDLYISSGQGKDQLYKNNGDGTFEEVSQQAGLNFLDSYVSQGATVADVNKDGWPDLFVATIANVVGEGFTEAPNILLINEKGTFVDRSEEFGIVEETFSSSASFGDFNGDGFPDLYVCNYFEKYNGTLDDFHGPQQNGDAVPGIDLLYINDGGQGFIESSKALGVSRRGMTFQALWTDFDNDRDLDLIIINDFGYRRMPNLLFRNESPSNTFTEIAKEKEFDYGINAMGIGACDINGDGWMDYKITNISSSPFFINQGPNQPFQENADGLGSSFNTVRANGGFLVTPYSWGINFFDVDHDMDSDLYITNGCLNPNLAPNPNLMLENIDGTFSDRGFFSRTNDQSIGRGSVVFDYDRDGDLDLFVVNQNPYKEDDIGVTFQGSQLYRNDTYTNHNWLKVQLIGTQSESSGIGSRIEAFVDDHLIVREIYGGSSHASQNSTIAHFGLADYTNLDSLIIKWSSGNTQVLYDVEVNQMLAVTEIINNEPKPVDKSTLLLVPNTFRDELVISYELPRFQAMDITVFDVQGKMVRKLTRAGAGAVGNFTWNVPADIPDGLYFFVLRTDNGYHVAKGIKN